MAISIDQFKQAFASKASDNGLAARVSDVEKSLKLLSAAVKRSEQVQSPAGEFAKVLKDLVQRFAKVSSKSAGADAATELDDIQRESQAVLKGLEATQSKSSLASSTTGPVAQAAPPIAAPTPPFTVPPTTTAQPTKQTPPTTTTPPKAPPVAPTKTETIKTGVVLVPDYKGMRARIIDWVAKNISKDQARSIVGRSNLRDIHTDAVIVLEQIGAEILATVKVGPGGKELERFHWDQSFTPSKPWQAADGFVAVEVEVLDSATGLPIKAAIVRLDDGKPYATDADGLAKIELPPQTTKKADISATGYTTFNREIRTFDSRVELEVRLTPVATSTLDLSEVNIHVTDITEAATPVPGATVKVGNFTKTTDDKGEVSFDLVPGEYAFTVTATDFVTETGKFDVRAGKQVVINEMVALKPVGSEDVYFRVISSKTKKPLANAEVRLASQQESTDSNGEARFLNIPFGEYRAGARADGYKVSAETIRHNKDSGTKFREFKLEPDKK
jgi:hypothetical protein